MTNSFEDLRRKLSREFDIEIDKTVLKRLDDSDVQFRASQLLPILARKMGKGVEDVRRRLKIGLDDALWINGKTTSEDKWQTFEVRLSTGLLLFHYKMVKLFVSRMTIVGDANEVVDETRISNDEMLSTAKRLMEAFWAHDESREHFFRSPDFSLLKLTKSQVELAASLLHHAEEFVVAHEFGHILMNASPERVKREMLIVEGARESMVRPVFDEHKGQGGKAMLQYWMDEIAADFIGVGLCKEQGEDEIQRMAIHSSAMMSLVMCDMLEKYYRMSTGGVRESETHPPSDLRLDVLQTLSDWPAGLDLGTSFRHFSDYVMSAI
jgi:hypothetical protein